tara:strand:+ start:552 stop:809 length:258 start_codon:yes stop_codon:yes gene_type:complete
MVVNNFIEQFIYAYEVTSQIMFPLLALFVILLLRDFKKYNDLSKKINDRLTDLSDLVENTGFKKTTSSENKLKYIERYLLKKNKN